MVAITEAGNLLQLEQALVDAINSVKRGEIDPAGISAKALKANTWKGFRDGIKRVALQFSGKIR